jgi:hypothetical protein
MVNLKVWINDTVVYHSKTGQKATLSFMNKLVVIFYKKENEYKLCYKTVVKIMKLIKIYGFVLFLLISCKNNIMNENNKSSLINTSTKDLKIATDTSKIVIDNELKESEDELKKRQLEDDKIYSELILYNGTYERHTESDGVNSSLILTYNNDKTFNYSWDFEVVNGEAICKANRKGIIKMDRTQHGFDNIGDCFIHFNFNGYWNGNMVIEIEFEDQQKCRFIKGQECTYSGVYIMPQND